MPRYGYSPLPLNRERCSGRDLRSTNGRFCAGPSGTQLPALRFCSINHLNNNQRTKSLSRILGAGQMQVSNILRYARAFNKLSRIC